MGQESSATWDSVWGCEWDGAGDANGTGGWGGFRHLEREPDLKRIRLTFGNVLIRSPREDRAAADGRLSGGGVARSMCVQLAW